MATAAFANDAITPADSSATEGAHQFQRRFDRFTNFWFAGIGIGAQTFFGDHNRQTAFTRRISPVFEARVGNWFSPNIGARVGINGFKLNGLTQNGSHSTGEVYRASDGLEKQEISYYNISLDVMFNFMNIFEGYSESHPYQLIPYVGLGFTAATSEPSSNNVGYNVGVYNTLRLNRNFDLTFDLRGTLVNDRFDGETGGRGGEGIVTGAFGIVYNFRK